MTDPANIPKGHHGMVWVFALDLPAAEVSGFSVEDSYVGEEGVRVPSSLRRALGGRTIDRDFMDIFDVAAMRPIGIRPYLTETCGISSEQVDADAALLEGLTGQIILIFSRALADGPDRFDVHPPLRLLARYGTDPMIPSFDPLPAESAKGIIHPPPAKVKSDARIGGMVALAALVVAFLVVAYIIWSAG